MSRHRPTLVRAAIVALLAVLSIAGPTAARTPVDPTTLTPAPPDFFGAVCFERGVRIMCDLAFSDEPIIDEPSGIVCGGVELLYSQSRDVVGKRTYRGDGLLLQRHFREDMRGTLDHPVTGSALAFAQSNTIIHDLGVAGDVDTGIVRIIGQGFKVTELGGRTVLVDAGWVAIDQATGEIADWAGPHRMDDYFVRGDTHALDAVCDAIA